MRCTLLNGPNIGKSYALNWDNRTATPIGGGPATGIATIFSGCSALSFIFGKVTGSLAGAPDELIATLEALHKGALVAA